VAARADPSLGQATVEFALSVTVFLALVCGVFDLGRGVYQNNGLSEAARELARVTSVHPGSPLGSSAETAAVLATQKSLIPNLKDPTFSCQDIDGSAVSGTCQPGDWVKVTIHAPFTPATPVIGLVGQIDFQSSSSIQIP
jgi:TadE-like protein